MICTFCQKEFDKIEGDLENTPLYQDIVQSGCCGYDCHFHYKQLLIPKKKIVSELVYNRIGEPGKEIDYFTIKFPEELKVHVSVNNFCYITDNFYTKVKKDLAELKSQHQFDSMIGMEYVENERKEYITDFLQEQSFLQTLTDLWDNKNFMLFQHLFSSVDNFGKVNEVFGDYEYHYLSEYMDLYVDFTQVRSVSDIELHFFKGLKK